MKKSYLTLALLSAISWSSLANLSINKELSNNSSELTAVELPDDFIEHKAVHFSQKISPLADISLQNKGFTSVSDEYWLEVTGAQLNKGVSVAITTPGALVRLSGKQSSSFANSAELAVDPSNIELLKGNKALLKPFVETVSQQQFATANIFPNSSAVKLDKRIGRGEFTLRVRNKLVTDQHYVINVKEKGSKQTLSLSLPKQSYLAGEQVNFDSFVKSNDRKLTAVTNHAFIKLPTGEKKAVQLQKNANKYSVTIPQSMQTAKRGALYELYIQSQATDKGLKILRNAKVAFAVAKPTAKVNKIAAVNAKGMKLTIDVASEGRYEVSGLVYGTAKNGMKMPFMLSRSAYYLQPGKQQIMLKFDNKILADAGLQAPYSVKQLRLMDQSRMALLQQL